MSLEDRVGFGLKFIAMLNGFPEPAPKPEEPVDLNMVTKASKLGVLADLGKVRQLLRNGSVTVNTVSVNHTHRELAAASTVIFSAISNTVIDNGIQATRGSGSLRNQSPLGMRREWLARAITLYKTYNGLDIAEIGEEGSSAPLTDEAIEEAWQAEGFLPNVLSSEYGQPIIAMIPTDPQPQTSVAAEA